jgi:branched-chain amino acid transport system substrate-binding protein
MLNPEDIEIERVSKEKGEKDMAHYARLAIAVVITVAAVAACGSSSKGSTSATTASGGTTAGTSASGGTNTASAPGVTPTSITIGFITDLTGVAASTYSDAQKGAQARINALNAAGGINGRKINLLVADSASSPSGFLTAAQDLVNKGAFAIIPDSSFTFGGYRYLHQNGIPVAGVAQDGPEWGQQPNTNMFSYTGGLDPHGPANTVGGLFFKSLGVTNVAGLAYGISPSSTGSIKDLKESLEAVGIKMGYENLSVPFGVSDFTTYALAMKQAGVDGATCSCVQSTNIAMAVGAKQAGIALKGALMFSGTDSSLFSNPTAVAAAQGTYWPSQIVPIDLHNPATDAFVANLQKYDSNYKGGYPSYGVTSAYLGTDVMIEGLQVAGQNPTRQSYINNMLKVSSWNDGLLASPIGFNHFGQAQPTLCQYFTKVEGNQFVTINNGKPFCGTVIPNSNVA